MTTAKSFRIRGLDRRRSEIPVASDRRRGPRRFGDDNLDAGEVTRKLSGSLNILVDAIGERLGKIQGRIGLVPDLDDGEVTQIPTRNPHLREAMHTLAGIEAEVVELVRKLRARGPVPGADRKRILALVQSIMSVDRTLADLMARRLGQPGDSPEIRGTRFLARVEKLLA